MDLILCHQTADFDALGAAVGLSCLKKGARIVLTGGAHPGVKNFLALHRDEFSLIERRSVNPKQIRSLMVVDSQQSTRLGKAAEWFNLPNITSIIVYDHHPSQESDIQATETYIEPVGATTTLIVELLQKNQIQLTPIEATVMALGIHVDTGSLIFEQSTPRDALALAWLMQLGANIPVIAEYVEPSLSPHLQKLLTFALDNLTKSTVYGNVLGWVLLRGDDFVPGLSNLTERLIDLTETDLLLLAYHYDGKLTIIGRSRIQYVNLNPVFDQLGGGGHSSAASVTISNIEDPLTTLEQLLEQLKAQIPQPPTARDLMSSPVRTIRPYTTIEMAQRILFRYGHSGLSVVNEDDQLVGIISRRDLDLALHHGFSHAPVKGYMTRNMKTITPDTSLAEIESIMVTYDVGRLPVLEGDNLIGIVTRTDVLRQLHQERDEREEQTKYKLPLISCLLPSIRDRLNSALWELLQVIASQAQSKGWHLYLVGGAVRDLLLTEDDEQLFLQDIDLVVDGFHRSADVGAGVELAKQLQELYPHARLSVHGEFQTAALLWHKDPQLGSLWLDIATARTEFYPYPAANPEVEASSIRQDLYRRDFTINALAVRLTSPKAGQLLDFFGGYIDLGARLIRVLHANSFIEDPTRIYRAVRFAVRLGFAIEPQTKEYIHYAIESGVYERLRLQNHPAPALTTRLKAELKYILEALYWQRAVQLLDSLQAWHCLHSSLKLDWQLWWQLRYISRWLNILDPENNLSHWLVRLEVIMGIIPDSNEREKSAGSLDLPKQSVERLQKLDIAEGKIKMSLHKCDRPSEIVKLLREYELVTLILVAGRSEQKMRRTIWEYITKLSKVKPLLNGNDLKKLGYKPGPAFKDMLEQILKATLDKEITNPEEAQIFLAKL